MVEVNLGSNPFYDVPFPVAIGNLYIHVRKDPNAGMDVQVFRWNPEDQTISKLEASSTTQQDEPVTVSPYGDTGGVRLIVRDGTLQGYATAGALAADSILLLPDRIAVYHGDTPTLEVLQASISGFDVGIEVTANGVAIGAPLPDGFHYRYTYEDQRISISTLVSPEEPVLARTTFTRCRIEGPALIAPTGALSLDSCHFNMLGAPLESLVWEVGQHGRPYGAILAQEVEFNECIRSGTHSGVRRSPPLHHLDT